MTKAKALLSLVPEAQWYLDGDTLHWLDPDIPQPTDEEIENEKHRLFAIEDLTKYQRLRKAEYDKLNQFEMQYNDAVNGTTTWVDAINEIKAKYPKP